MISQPLFLAPLKLQSQLSTHETSPPHFKELPKEAKSKIIYLLMNDRFPEAKELYSYYLKKSHQHSE